MLWEESSVTESKLLAKLVDWEVVWVEKEVIGLKVDRKACGGFLLLVSVVVDAWLLKGAGADLAR